MIAAANEPGPLLACSVVIRMPDGSRGEHNGLYYHRMDALAEAMDLFPGAKLISVSGGKSRIVSQAHTCDALGVCNSRHCSDVGACPDYDPSACNDTSCQGHAEIAAKGLCHYKRPQRRFTDRPGCASEAYPQPTYPFAPGVIQRQPIGAAGEFCGASDRFPLSLFDTAVVLVVVLVLVLAGLIMGGAE
ncbi:hypothetical protein [Rhodoferax sp.]|uniref:hypothetical protein n=1 Tax=Rhodoferax sp. TaxID=50421 RepID=UPI00283FEC95|nr:hypothetical protein [Rhodoferax sp.]MDR3370699.1 hypothetical protein [Rhodoferax sp.]